MSGEIQNQEFLAARYYSRELQVKEILKEATKESIEEDETDKDSSKLLALTLITSPVLFPLLLEKSGLNKDQLIDKIIPATRLAAKRAIMLVIFSRLLEACHFDCRSTSEVAIDSLNPEIPNAYKLVFADHAPILEEIVSAGSIQASLAILRLVQGKAPLFRYKRDLAQKRIKLEATVGGGLSGFLPTKIPNVDIRYLYQKGQQTPTLSFLVKNF